MTTTEIEGYSWIDKTRLRKAEALRLIDYLSQSIEIHEASSLSGPMIRWLSANKGAYCQLIILPEKKLVMQIPVNQTR